MTRFRLIALAVCVAFTIDLDDTEGCTFLRNEGWKGNSLCSIAFQRFTLERRMRSAGSVHSDQDIGSSSSAVVGSFSSSSNSAGSCKTQRLESSLYLSSPPHKQIGLYRPFASHAWYRLLDVCGSNLEIVALDGDDSKTTNDNINGSNVCVRETPAPGVNGGTIRITIQAARGKQISPSSPSLIQYARYALLETLSANLTESDEGQVQTTGIQVLNFVIFPTAASGLPVFGADFVALPGNKHLLLLDAQPMRDEGTDGERVSKAAPFIRNWKEWYNKHNIAVEFPWNSELPEQILPYVSEYALWTRLGAKGPKESSESDDTLISVEPNDPIDQIQVLGMQAFVEHLDIYLDLIQSQEKQLYNTEPPDESTSQHPSRLVDYVTYRLENDPARPMLKRLYGEEWTEHVLHSILFPLGELSS